tara:strand:- start:253 stop:1494 length:1242 start_codon:yes stop_codon:yes gene_type:complete
MNTIPKLEINQSKLENSANIKDAYFQDRYHKVSKIFWNQPGQLEIAGIDILMSSDFTSLQEFQELSNYYQKILEQIKTDLDIPLIFIGSSFNMVLEASNSTLSKMSRGKIFIPKCLYVNKGGVKNLFTINHADSNYQIEPIEHNVSNQELKIQNETSKEDFYNMIEDSKNLIDNTELEKIVISRKKTYDFDFNYKEQFNFITMSENQFPECTTFLYDFKDSGIFFGITPETLFNTKNNQFYSEALAGTFDLSVNKASSKEIREHHFVVSYLKKEISSFSYDENIQAEPHLINLGKMKHLKTEIKSRLKEEVSPFNIIYKLHPTPAVAGYPNKVAVSNINELEEHDRGWYSGPIGWISTQCNSEFKVAIRSGFSKKGELDIFAGCGITEDSQNELEYNESEMKFNSILSVLNHE